MPEYLLFLNYIICQMYHPDYEKTAYTFILFFGISFLLVIKCNVCDCFIKQN